MAEKLLPDVYFGEVQDQDDEELFELEDELPDDDEVLKVTPADVVDVLGFDPLELDSE